MTESSGAGSTVELVELFDCPTEPTEMVHQRSGQSVMLVPKDQWEQLRATEAELRAKLAGSLNCEQHEHFSGGCPCNCHDTNE